MTTASVPKRKKGESPVAYHDRLAELIRQAESDGNDKRSRELQLAAGKLAARSERVRAEPREDGLSGPGTYPWYECVGDQLQRGYDEKGANAVCGRIRADSRKRYPVYWAERDRAEREERKPKGKSKASPARRRVADAPGENPLPLLPLIPLAAHTAAGVIGGAVGHSVASHINNPASEAPFCGIGLNGGPHFRGPGPRDNVVVLSRSGAVLEFIPIHGPPDMEAINQRYPDLPIFGPFNVIASDIRDLRRRAAQPVIERRRSS